MNEDSAKKLLYLIAKAQKTLKEEKNIKINKLKEILADVKLAEQLLDIISEDKNQDVRKLLKINTQILSIKHLIKEKERKLLRE